MEIRFRVVMAVMLLTSSTAFWGCDTATTMSSLIRPTAVTTTNPTITTPTVGGMTLGGFNIVAGSCEPAANNENIAAIRWSHVDGASGYIVYRRAWSSGQWEVADVRAGSDHWERVRADTDFYYRVVAVDSSNNTRVSEPAEKLICRARN